MEVCHLRVVKFKSPLLASKRNCNDIVSNFEPHENRKFKRIIQRFVYIGFDFDNRRETQSVLRRAMMTEKIDQMCSGLSEFNKTISFTEDNGGDAL